MNYGYLGRANVMVSKICLGTMHFGAVTDEKDAFRIMDRALDGGINFFDTADIYGGPGGWGRSEEIIGRWLAQSGGRREKIVLATKVYWYDRDATEWPNEAPGISMYKVRKSVQGSLQRLQTDHIDLYQVHHIDRRVTTDEYWTAFDRLVADGDVLYMGTSNFPGWGLAKFQQAAEDRGSVGIVSEQHMYNLLCRYPELEVLPAAASYGIGVLSYMPLAGGLLTGNRAPAPGSRTAGVSKEYGIPLDNNERLDAFRSLCKEIGEEERNVAIAWVLAHEEISSAIVGIRTLEHLEGIFRAADIALDAEVIDRIDRIFPIGEGRPLRAGSQTPEAYAW